MKSKQNQEQEIVFNFSIDLSFNNDFGHTFFGYIKIEEEGVYGFQTVSDDGSRLLINDVIYDAISDYSSINNVFGHGYTYSGHPVAAAVALETINIFKDENIIGHVQNISEKFNAKIRQLNDYSIVGNARSIGLIGAIELVKDKKNKTCFDPKIAVGARIVKNAQSNGLIVRALQGDIVALCPPLIINSKELDILFKKLNKSIKETEVELNTEGLM